MVKGYRTIWEYVKHEQVVVSGVKKKYFRQVSGKKIIGHMALTALVLASIQTSAVFAYSDEVKVADQSGISLYKIKDTSDPVPGGSSSGSSSGFSSSGSSSGSSSSGSSSGSGSSGDSGSSSGTTGGDSTTDTPGADVLGDIHYISVKGTTTGNSSNYNNDGAKSENSVVIGVSSSIHADAQNSNIIGSDSYIGLYGSNGTVIGHSSSINATGRISAEDSIVIGNSSSTLAKNSLVIGNSSSLAGSGWNSILIGHNSSSILNDTLVFGNHITLNGNNGYSSFSGENNSVVIGHEITVGDGNHNVILATDYVENGEQKTTHVSGQFNTVIGVGNIVGYTAEKNGNSWTYSIKNGERDGNVIVGERNTSHGNGTVIVGFGSEAENLDISLGFANKVNVEESKIPTMGKHGEKSVALGCYLDVWGYKALAVGSNGKATGHYTIAIGTESNAYDACAISMGYQANANQKFSLSIGAGTQASAEKATAFGKSATASVADGVALGSNSVANVENNVAGYDPKTGEASTDTSAAWKSSLGAVSVGNSASGYTRQITNVAAGFKDTDAVNLAQLKRAIADSDNERANAITEINARISNIQNDATLETDDKALSLNGKKLSINLKDTSGNTVSGSVDLSDVMTGGTDTTLVNNDNALSLNDNTLSISFKDTAGNQVSGSVDLSGFASIEDTNTTYTMTGTQNTDNTTTIKLTGSDGKTDEVTVATRDTRNTVKAGENVTVESQTQADGSSEYTIQVKADGKVEKGNTKLISGDTVYGETRVASDGTYVKESNTAGENLTALDSVVQNHTDAIDQINTHMTMLGSEVRELDTRINKVGASAAALAALHPLDFNPEDKWDLAAGFGNYRNESAAALGLFYRPNERTLFNMGCTIGDDRNMFNAGFSVKLGHGSAYNGLSKADLAAVVTEQKDEIAQLKQTVEMQDKKIQEVEEQMRALLEKIK